MTQRVLVVIPTLNEVSTIREVLAELRQGLPAGLDVRFVVADGGSTDGTPAVVLELSRIYDDLELLHNPHRLQSAAVNLAVQRWGAGYTVLIRCDAHAHYPPGFVVALLRSLESHNADAVVVPMDSVGDTCTRKAVAWVSDTLVGSGGSAHRSGRKSEFVDHGHHAAFRMDSFVRAGGYDETFSHNEDAELDCRQRALGSKIFLDADIRLRYIPRSTLQSLWRQYFNYGRGRSRTVRRHPDSLRLRQFAVPAHVLVCALALLLSPVWPILLAWPLAYLVALAATGVQLAVRHQSACGLLGAPAAWIMHNAWAVGFAAGLMTLRESRWLRERDSRALYLEPAIQPEEVQA